MTIDTLGAQTELATLPHDGKTTEFDDPTTGLVKLPVVVKKLTVHGNKLYWTVNSGNRLASDAPSCTWLEPYSPLASSTRKDIGTPACSKAGFRRAISSLLWLLFPARVCPTTIVQVPK